VLVPHPVLPAPGGLTFTIVTSPADAEASRSPSKTSIMAFVVVGATFA
jgi:hypothetical protein